MGEKGEMREVEGGRGGDIMLALYIICIHNNVVRNDFPQCPDSQYSTEWFS